MIASQMPDAIFDNKTIDIVTNNSQSGDKYIFQIVGSKLKFDGFRAIYIEGTDDESDSINGKSNDLPDLQQDETVECLDKIAEQNFTKPPNRFLNSCPSTRTIMEFFLSGTLSLTVSLARRGLATLSPAEGSPLGWGLV